MQIFFLKQPNIINKEGLHEFIFSFSNTLSIFVELLDFQYFLVNYF